MICQVVSLTLLYILISVIFWNAVDHAFDPWSEIKDYEIDICCFSAEQTTLKTKIKDLLAQSQDMSKWNDRSSCIIL